MSFDGSSIVSYSYAENKLYCYKPTLPGLGILGTLIGTISSAAMDAVSNKNKQAQDYDISNLSRIVPNAAFDCPLVISPNVYESEKEKEVDLINSVKLEWNSMDVIHLHSLGNSRFTFNCK
eukprot:NODE_532_length_7089_cov_0.272103.p4 type:complete len:121 gc:universal NODE_532_length_7089_cov_0.272103:3375-3013(-)